MIYGLSVSVAIHVGSMLAVASGAVRNAHSAQNKSISRTQRYLTVAGTGLSLRGGNPAHAPEVKLRLFTKKEKSPRC